MVVIRGLVSVSEAVYLFQRGKITTVSAIYHLYPPSTASAISFPYLSLVSFEIWIDRWIPLRDYLVGYLK